jgi:hypothetical protein
MMPELATFPTLIWQAGIEDSLSDGVFGAGSLRHGWDSNESRKFKDISDLQCDHGAGWPFNV